MSILKIISIGKIQTAFVKQIETSLCHLKLHLWRLWRL